MAVEITSSRGSFEPREIASGIDTLIISLRGELPDTLVAALIDAKAAAVELQSAVEMNFGGVSWQVQPWAFGKYPFNLMHEFGFLGFTSSRSLPMMRWQPRAEALHALGPLAISRWLVGLAELEVGPVTTAVSRVDVHADFQGVVFNHTDKESFVTYAKSCRANWDQDVFSGFSFGSRGSKSVSARIYDKTLEIAKKGGTYWFDYWGDLYDDQETVWRIEYEFHRTFLRKFGVHSLEDVFTSLGGLWKYGTDNWLSLRVPTLDETHARWPVDEMWKSIQNASPSWHAVGLEKVRAARRGDELHRTLPQVNGWLARLAALLSLESSEDLIDQLPMIMEKYEHSSKIEFHERIDQKRKSLGLP